jgi:MYXO-CTERM domain-containing protein
MAKLAAAVAVGVAGIGAAQHADASLIIDLRATAVNGLAIPASKDVTVEAGNTVTMSIFAQVSGTNAANDDTVQSVAGNIVSTGGLLGNLSAAPTNTGSGLFNFRGNGAQNGATQDLDADGDLDVGTPMNNQNVTQFFNARSNGPVTPGTVLSASQAEVLIGRVTFTVGAGADGETFVNFVNRVENNGTPATEGAVWFQDGGFDGDGNVQSVNPFNPTVAGAVFDRGSAVRLSVIPEPTGLALAGVAGLGLLARRRKNA